jgi:hypothetical protein
VLAPLALPRAPSLRLGACTLSPVGPEGREKARRRIAAGAGPLSVGLAADAPGGELDRRLSHGVIIRVAGG